MLFHKLLIVMVYLFAAGIATAGADAPPVPYNVAQIAGSGLASGLAAEAGNVGWVIAQDSFGDAGSAVRAWRQLVSGRAALMPGNEATPGLLYYVGIALIGFVMVGRRRDRSGSGCRQ
ncbi:MAG: hypothetical protein RQ736_06950 [Thiogranum sp.]|nr:hypothetical protein [Thiogranum sp.]